MLIFDWLIWFIFLFFFLRTVSVTCRLVQSWFWTDSLQRNAGLKTEWSPVSTGLLRWVRTLTQGLSCLTFRPYSSLYIYSKWSKRLWAQLDWLKINCGVILALLHYFFSASENAHLPFSIQSCWWLHITTTRMLPMSRMEWHWSGTWSTRRAHLSTSSTAR